ncbi:MAG: hypothetical protein GY856_41950 [bacterium]|nr:hypothetical protein [bacterium]
MSAPRAGRAHAGAWRLPSALRRRLAWLRERRACRIAGRPAIGVRHLALPLLRLRRGGAEIRVTVAGMTVTAPAVTVALGAHFSWRRAPAVTVFSRSAGSVAVAPVPALRRAAGIIPPRLGVRVPSPPAASTAATPARGWRRAELEPAHRAPISSRRLPPSTAILAMSRRRILRSPEPGGRYETAQGVHPGWERRPHHGPIPEATVRRLPGSISARAPFSELAFRLGPAPSMARGRIPGGVTETGLVLQSFRSTVKRSMVQRSTVQRSTVQRSTVQRSTVVATSTIRRETVRAPGPLPFRRTWCAAAEPRSRRAPNLSMPMPLVSLLRPPAAAPVSVEHVRREVTASVLERVEHTVEKEVRQNLGPDSPQLRRLSERLFSDLGSRVAFERERLGGG